MPAVKLKECDSYRFSYDIKVRVTDINYGGHVGGTEMVGILHTARSMMYEEMGFSENRLGASDVWGFISDFAINYRGEAFLSDIIQVNCGVSEITKKGFRVFYQVKREGKTIVIAEHGIISFSREKNRVTDLPEIFVKALKS